MLIERNQINYLYIHHMKFIVLLTSLLILLSCIETIQSSPETEIINLPVSKPSNFETTDSSFLKIGIENNTYKVLYLKDTSLLAGIEGLDNFLLKHKRSLNRDKIIVTGFDDNAKQKAFKDLLVKYGISKFRVNMK